MKHIIGQAPAVNGVVTIQHIIIADDPFGEPWPPDGFCVALKRAHLFTLCRRLSLPPTTRSAVERALKSGSRTTNQGLIVMSNEVTVRHSQQITNIETAAREDAAFEKMLKCKKGEYWIQDQQIPLGTQYLAHTTGWVKCWIKFADGEVAERKMYRVAFGEKAPEREDLGDLDQDEWPEGLDEKPADPWVFQYLLPFENLETGEVVIFVTSSFGGRLAVADLCNAYVKRCKKNPRSGQPIIRLAKAEMPTKKFGKVPRPLFEIIRWDDDGAEFIETPPATLQSDMNDEIPFSPEWRG